MRPWPEVFCGNFIYSQYKNWVPVAVVALSFAVNGTFFHFSTTACLKGRYFQQQHIKNLTLLHSNSQRNTIMKHIDGGFVFRGSGDNEVFLNVCCELFSSRPLSGSLWWSSSPYSHVAVACKISWNSQRCSQEDSGSPTCMCLCVSAGTTLALAPFWHVSSLWLRDWQTPL